MDYAATPAPRRRFVRRSLPWLLAMSLFAGGGYGVYTYAAPEPGDGATTAEAGANVDPFAADAAGAMAASDQINQLFSSTPAAESAAPAPTGSESAPLYANRYTAVAAPAAEPASPTMSAIEEQANEDAVATPRSAAAVTLPNPFASAAPDQVPSGDDADAAAEAPIEVARGQEPASENPLRGGAPTGSPAARAAFAEAAPTAQPNSIESAPAPAAPSTPLSAGNPFSRYSAGPVAASAGASDTPTAASMFGGEPTGPVAQSTAGPAPTLPNVEPTAAEPASIESAAPPMTEPAPSPAVPQRFAPMSEKPLRPQAAAQSFAAEVAPEPAAAATVAPAPTAAPQYMASASGFSNDVTPTPGITAVEGSGRPGDRSLEGVQAPTLTIQKLAPAEVQVGKKCTFAVKVQNTGRVPAQNVQIHDEVPQGAQLVGSAPKAAVAGAQLTWDVGTLSAGEERLVEMELLPMTEGELGSVATVTFAAQASAKARCTRPELELRLAAGPRVMIGQQHVVEIELTNPGSGDATGVMLLESVPAGVTHEAGPALEFEIGTLRAGETRRLDLVLTAAEAGRINNMMTARADAGLEVQAACEFEVIAPKLAVSVEGPSRRYLERPATYTVYIENPGTAPAKEVQLITQLPRGLKFVSANNLGEYDSATHSVHWSLAELPANERGTVELTALPVEAGEHKLQIASRAEQGLEERTETQLVVEGLVALSFDIDAADGAIEVGGETAYDVTVVNNGSKPAANVQVVAVIPPGLRATGGQGATRHVVEGDRVMFAPIPQLPPKGEAKFRVQVQGLRAGDQRTRIMVMADEVPEPITKEESTRVYSDQ